MALSFINTSGNIISEDFCQQLLIETKAEYVKSKSFGEDVKKIDEDIAVTYELLRERWEEIRSKVLENKFDTTQLREKWIKPFLNLLGFDLFFLPHNLKNQAGLEYYIPYKGWNSEDAPLIHMVNSNVDFDTRDKNSRTHPNKSPHDVLQQFLNTSHHRWAILANGKKIRILRDFYHSITKGFIEFDVEGIFETASTEQFRILYRVLHKSRFIGQYECKDEESEKVSCLLEKFHILSRETGIKVGENLRKQVRIAIETFGNGFAENLNPDNYNEIGVKNFYSEILNIIYRLLFMLFAEQKGWLPVKNDIYARTYSVNSLREKAERAEYHFDDNEDLWEGLKVTFKLVTKGYTFPNGDHLNAFGGQLFSDERIYHIKSPLKNKYLLKAIDALCFFTENNIRNKINYAALAIDELGSVYESLLDYEPRLLKENITLNNKPFYKGEFVLDDRSTERKTTGSYYTDSRLVAQLIDSALVPVIENALTGKPSIEEKRKAILDLKVADIACGSGAFLIAALEKLGEYLSLIGKEEGEKPTEDELRQAKREVLQNCIYGVDLNPMAVGLAKFSLWITASMPNLPLSFLDHKIKCGNSLIGATPELIKKGIPAEAFNPVTLDNKDVCTYLKKKVKKEIEGFSRDDKGVQTSIDFKVAEPDSTYIRINQYKHILTSEQEDVEEVETLAHEYEEVYKTLRSNKDWRLADTWTAAFFILKDTLNKKYPTNLTLQEISKGTDTDEDLPEEIKKLAKEYGFFHFHLEFPEVHEKGGFDCILGNPPWEKVQPEQEQFFMAYYPEIAKVKDSNQRNLLIENLKETDISTFNLWENYRISIYRFSDYLTYSGRYVNSATGNRNLYRIFTDSILQNLNNYGSSGIIVQSGIYADDLGKVFFEFLLKNNYIKCLYDFENTEKYFQQIDSRMRYSLVTLMKNNESKPKYCFFIRRIEELLNRERVFNLTLKEIETINPNTKNCPQFMSRVEADLVLRIYNNIHTEILLNESKPNELHLISEMINISRAPKKLFIDLNESEIENYLPVLEAKNIYYYDHRYSTFNENQSRYDLEQGNSIDFDIAFKQNPSSEITCRYKVPIAFYTSKIDTNYKLKWYIGIRGISSSTNEKTLICSAIPQMPISYSINLIQPKNHREGLILLSNLNSYILDFITRVKVSNNNISLFIIKQLPIIKYECLSSNLEKIIIDKVLELNCTSNSLKFLLNAIYPDKDVFQFNDKSRFYLKCELDAIYAHLYGITREEFDYILETFPIVKRKDMEKYGTYRTKDTILKLFDEMEWVKEEVNLVKANNIKQEQQTNKEVKI